MRHYVFCFDDFAAFPETFPGTLPGFGLTGCDSWFATWFEFSQLNSLLLWAFSQQDKKMKIWNFQKLGVDRTLIFRGGLVGKRGVTFSGEGRCKDELKSEIFNDKKVYKKNVFLCHNKEFKLGNFN